MRKLIKVFVFLIIGGMLGIMMQNILIPKWYWPDTTLPETRIISGIRAEKENSIQVIACGTSHMQFGFSPMELYGEYGITAYNLATSAQPIQVGYYLLKSAVKSQKPEVIIFDASSLFYENTEDGAWRYALDQLPFNKDKLEFANVYLETWRGETYLCAAVPLARYHTRWKSLTPRDFTDFFRKKRYYCKGYHLFSKHASAGINLEGMNYEMQRMLDNNERMIYEYLNSGEYNEKIEENALYNAYIPDKNIGWLLKIKELCDKNQVELLVTKTPIVQWPETYFSAWTTKKSDMVRSLCEEHNIAYFDLQYDTEVGIDWDRDSGDGAHLNLYGAQKVSSSLGQYLSGHYSLDERRSPAWDEDLSAYNRVKSTALLELEQDFINYINRLSEEKQDRIIFIAASDDMSQGLTNDDIDALRLLGIRSDVGNVFRGSFTAVVERGETKYEALSNRRIIYDGITSEGMAYYLESSGWDTGAYTSIKLGGVEYAYNGKGINIVVYDPKSGLVLDSVCFDVSRDPHIGQRDNNRIEFLLKDYEYYIMEEEER